MSLKDTLVWNIRVNWTKILSFFGFYRQFISLRLMLYLFACCYVIFFIQYIYEWTKYLTYFFESCHNFVFYTLVTACHEFVFYTLVTACHEFVFYTLVTSCHEFVFYTLVTACHEFASFYPMNCTPTHIDHV